MPRSSGREVAKREEREAHIRGWEEQVVLMASAVGIGFAWKGWQAG
jgi:hypothetical protein